MNGELHEKLFVFLHDDLSIILLPTLFAFSMVKTGSYHRKVFVEKKNGFVNVEFKVKSITYNTINEIASQLFSYISWVQQYSIGKHQISLENHYNFPEILINHYVNEVLVKEAKKGSTSAEHAVMALDAYYTWLAKTGIGTVKNIYIKPTAIVAARKNSRRRNVIKYLTPRLRSEYYRECDSLLDECILRAGGGLGIRSCENRGFFLNDFSYGHIERKGLMTLFKEAELHPEKQVFEYFLSGEFSKSKGQKGGESRYLYLSRDLLLRFKLYFDTERSKSNKNTFFLTSSCAWEGYPIGPRQGTNIFNKVKKKLLIKQKKGLIQPGIQIVDEEQSYHLLRHSAGTDCFYDLCERNNIQVDDVTTHSAVMLEVAKLLGHALTGRYGPETTKLYIRLTREKLSLEEEL